MREQQGPVAILKTFPAVFFREVTKREFIRDFVHGLNDFWAAESWLVPMSNVPKRDVLAVREASEVCAQEFLDDMKRILQQ